MRHSLQTSSLGDSIYGQVTGAYLSIIENFNFVSSLILILPAVHVSEHLRKLCALSSYSYLLNVQSTSFSSLAFLLCTRLVRLFELFAYINVTDEERSSFVSPFQNLLASIFSFRLSPVQAHTKSVEFAVFLHLFSPKNSLATILSSEQHDKLPSSSQPFLTHQSLLSLQTALFFSLANFTSSHLCSNFKLPIWIVNSHSQRFTHRTFLLNQKIIRALFTGESWFLKTLRLSSVSQPSTLNLSSPPTVLSNAAVRPQSREIFFKHFNENFMDRALSSVQYLH